MNDGSQGGYMKSLKYFVVLLAGALILSGCSGSPVVSGVSSAPVTEVQAAAPVKAETGILTEAAVIPRESVSLGFGLAGIVEDVVKEGSDVKQGAVIARLKDSAKMESEVAAAELDLLTAQKAVQDLKDQQVMALAQANLRLANADKKLDKAKKDSQSMAYRVSSDDTIAVLRAELLVAQEGVKTAQEMCGDCESTSEYNVNKAALMTQLANSRQVRNRAQANLNYAISTPNNFDVHIANAQLQVAQAEYDEAARQVGNLKNGPDPAEYKLAQARVNNSQARLQAAKVALADLEIRSPIDGIVMSSDIKTGEMVDPAIDKIVVADTSAWQIETTNLTEMDVVQIQVGSSVDVTVDALPGESITGKVLRIRPVGQNKQGDITYTAVIKLDKQDPRLLWNMTASARIHPSTQQ
jgi:multidrug resistance efflux pump